MIERQIMEDLLADGSAQVLEPRNVFDVAMVGMAELGGSFVAVYDADKILEALMKQNDWDIDQALEHYDFNMQLTGPGAPLYLDIVVEGT